MHFESSNCVCDSPKTATNPSSSLSSSSAEAKLPKIPITSVVNKLESPSEQTILLRKQIMVEKLLKKKGKTGTTSFDDNNKGGAVHDGVRKTLKMGPSSILNRVKEFLPVMKMENEKLLLKVAENPATVSLEVNNGDEEHVHGHPMIELNLALMSQENDDGEGGSDSDSSNQSQKNRMENESDTIGHQSGDYMLKPSIINAKKLIEEMNQDD